MVDDSQLLATASCDDLSRKEERRRSADDLALLFFRLYAACEPDLFVEAGAKDAGSSRRAHRFYKPARKVAFEANPYTYEKFAPLNPVGGPVEYIHTALADAPGEVTLNVRLEASGRPRPDGHASLLERAEGYGHDFVQRTVASTTIDHFFDGYAYRTCAMWIDVEGAGRQVLGGAEVALGRCLVAIMEVEERPAWEGAWLAPDVFRLFQRYGMVPAARDFEYKYQYNAIFLREELLADPRVRYRLTQHHSRANHPEPAPSQLKKWVSPLKRFRPRRRR